MTPSRLTVPVVAWLLWSSATAQEPNGRVHEDAVHSFRIERPKDWRFLPATSTGSSAILRVRPLAAKGKGKGKGKGPGPGQVEASVRVQPVRAGSQASALLQPLLARLAADRKYSVVERLATEIAGRQAPGVRVEFVAPDRVTYVLQLHYLVSDGLRYTLQFHAPVEIWPKVGKEFEGLRSSFRLLPASEAVRRGRQLDLLADRCGTEIEWAASWRSAAALATKQNKLVLVQVRFYAGFKIADSTRSGVYMHPDVVELIGERFVAFRLRKGLPVPFRSQQRYGMSAKTFGQAILIVTPAGEVLRETSTEQPHAVYDFLVDALARNPEFTGLAAGTKPPEDGLAAAAWHLRRGELKLAAMQLESLESPESPQSLDGRGVRAHRLRAGLFRRRRQGDAALAEIRRARAAGADGAADAALSIEEVVLLLRMGRDGAAGQGLDRQLALWPALREDPGVVFWKGVCELQAGRADAAAQWWKRLMAEHARSRWAWQAAALSRGRGRMQVAWPAAELLGSLRSRVGEVLPVTAVGRAERAAVAFLLRRQRADGSWISPREVRRVAKMSPSPFIEAVTAICARSLLQRRSTDGCRQAAERALGWLLASHERGKRYPLPRSYMDYTVWSKAFVLWFLGDCVAAELGDSDGIRACMSELVQDLAARRRATGGWSYYVTADLESTNSSSQSISFVTAPVLMALLRARSAGVSIPAELTESATDCLAQMRVGSGAFAYFLHAGGRPAVRGVAGAAGRGPVCELALFRAGRGSVQHLRQALATFMKHRAGLAKEVGKALMHAGPEGQGCHYPMFDYAFAAAAVAALPRQERAGYRKPLIELMMRTRSVEGAFRDAQFNGWEYGTAMALLLFRSLADTR